MTHSKPGDQREVLKLKSQLKQAPCKRTRPVLILAFEVWFINAPQRDCKTRPSPFGNIECSCLVAQIGYVWAGQCWAGPPICHWQVLSNVLMCFLYSFENPVLKSVWLCCRQAPTAVRCWKRYYSKDTSLLFQWRFVKHCIWFTWENKFWPYESLQPLDT